jgi:integrase
MGLQKPPGLTLRGETWHIDKDIYGTRICESTSTGDLREAVAILSRRIEEVRARRFFGARKARTFREAATRFLEENQHKRSLERDARSLAALDPYIGALTIEQVHSGSLQAFVRGKLKAGKSPGTINRDLAVVRRILNLCARLWRDEDDRPWLDTAPLIQMQRHPDKRTPYPLSMEEQRLLFSELAPHLARMALFKVNTGTREHEVCTLRWSWEVRVPELDTSVFIIPRDHVKNGLERFVVLNRIAKSVIEGCRGEHDEFVFTTQERDGPRHPQFRMNNSGWRAARRRAAARYEQELGSRCPAGFRSIRVHDLKHTLGYRLRAAGVSFEDRQALLGHKAAHITTHYSAADISSLIACAESVCDLASRKSPALSIVRSAGRLQVTENAGGKGGTRTLDPGIMRTAPDKNTK